jgi:hypothetical protein
MKTMSRMSDLLKSLGVSANRVVLDRTVPVATLFANLDD